MVSRSGRIFLILIGIFLTLRLLTVTNGHDSLQRSVMAFFNGASQPLVVLNGELTHPGVYAISDASSLMSVINLAGLSAPCQGAICSYIPRSSPEVIKLNVYLGQSKRVEIAEEIVSTREKILLGLPLQPDQLLEEDWTMLPGIGPVMERRLVEDRQINGDFGTFRRLIRVEGVGSTTLTRMAPYFVNKQ